MNKKNEIRDKVKEIKQRQQNWLKQRAESQHPVNDNENTLGASKPGNVTEMTAVKEHTLHDTNPVQRDHSKPYKQSLAQSLISSNKSNAKFHNWLKTKQSNTDSEGDAEDNEQSQRDVSYNSDRYSQNYYNDMPYRDHQGSEDVNILRVPSTRSPEFATPDPGWNSDDETGEISAAQLLSPDNFDARADDIIAKVKGDISIPNLAHAGLSHGDYKYVNAKSVNIDPAPQSDQELSSHVCPTCEKLMMPPNTSPMILIPCGHTLCNRCSKKTKYCAMCGCVVQSSTLNIMLQQIITNFHTKQTHRQTTRKSVSDQVHNTNYQEEYQNLITRQEILQEESQNISRNVQRLTKKLNQDQQQVANIQRREADIELEMKRLERKIQELTGHRLSYEKNCYTLEIETTHEKNRLVLVNDSLTSVQQQMEKIKMLAEGDF